MTVTILKGVGSQPTVAQQVLGKLLPKLSHKDIQQINTTGYIHKDSEMHYNQFTIITQYIIISHKITFLELKLRTDPVSLVEQEGR